MVAREFSALSTGAAAALGNHLWQSTVFAIAVGMLTLTLRKNRAGARYCLWLVASMKFLIPFSILIALGRNLAWPRNSGDIKGRLYTAIEQVSRPFTQLALSGASHAGSALNLQTLIYLLPKLLAAVWLCGFVTVILVWGARWRRISAAVRDSEPLHEGREIEMLRRLECTAGIRKPIKMLLSRTTLEPGIFGITSPALLWSEGMSVHLDDAHLEAVLAHELWHVRRRDNLTAVLQMMVEAIFWFHPLVWRLGARLVDERERACDELVLELGSQRQVYAESILKVCEFCLGSPLACVSGVTGADLKKRMVHIMSEHVVRKLDFTRRMLLTAAALVAVGMPVGLGIVSPLHGLAQSDVQNATISTPTYEAVSIKPNQTGEPMAPFKIVGKPALGFMVQPGRFLATNATLHQLTRFLYGVHDDQVVGGPSWFDTEHYDVDVTLGKSTADELRKLNEDQQFSEEKQMLQVLLADRFRLVLHREARDVSQKPQIQVLVIDHAERPAAE